MKIGTILENKSTRMRVVIGVGGDPRWLNTGEPVFNRLDPEEWDECVVTNPEVFDSLDLLRGDGEVILQAVEVRRSAIPKPVRVNSNFGTNNRVVSPSQQELGDQRGCFS